MKSIASNILKSPILHFLVLGTAVFFLYVTLKPPDRETIRVTTQTIDALVQQGQAYVKQGILNACFEYPTGGAQAIDLALKILRGEDVPKEVVLPFRVFTPDNIDQGGDWVEKPEGL